MRVYLYICIHNKHTHTYTVFCFVFFFIIIIIIFLHLTDIFSLSIYYTLPAIYTNRVIKSYKTSSETGIINSNDVTLMFNECHESKMLNQFDEMTNSALLLNLYSLVV